VWGLDHTVVPTALKEAPKEDRKVTVTVIIRELQQQARHKLPNDDYNGPSDCSVHGNKLISKPNQGKYIESTANGSWVRANFPSSQIYKKKTIR
jgi:hypothetical protein